MTEGYKKMESSKIYYKIGEVSHKLGVASHTLRYWEEEFSSFLKPKRNGRGQRLYTDKEVEIISRIRELLYQQGYRVSAAKRFLRGTASSLRGIASLTKRKETVSFPRTLLSELNRLDRLLARISRI
ncbi:MAG: MerR family transcriptional regulator [Candidatus Omnitrophota bacterium]